MEILTQWILWTTNRGSIMVLWSRSPRCWAGNFVLQMMQSPNNLRDIGAKTTSFCCRFAWEEADGSKNPKRGKFAPARPTLYTAVSPSLCGIISLSDIVTRYLLLNYPTNAQLPHIHGLASANLHSPFCQPPQSTMTAAGPRPSWQCRLRPPHIAAKDDRMSSRIADI